jgi:hypothetical protein
MVIEFGLAIIFLFFKINNEKRKGSFSFKGIFVKLIITVD